MLVPQSPLPGSRFARSTLILLLAVTAASVLMAAGAEPLVLRKATTAPTIDGKPDETCWEQADKRPLLHIAGDKLSAGGEVALCHDDQSIYAALWLDEPEPDKIRAPRAENASAIWDGEVVEWFIEVNAGERRYVQLAWNPSGAKMSSRCRSTGGGNFEADSTWRPEWQCASVIGGRGWTSEAAISFKELGIAAPAEGETLRLNLGRTRQVGAREFSAMAPTGGGGFHQPDRFARVWFGKHVPADERVERSEAVTALVGHRMVHYHGYGGDASPNPHLDRALKPENVSIRVSAIFAKTMLNWPDYGQLARHHVVVLTDVPAKKFSPDQIADLCRFVESGGAIILLGPMAGWRHDAKNSWMNSPFMAYMPLKPAEKPATPEGRITAAADHPLFRNIPLEQVALTAYSPEATPAAEAVVLAQTRAMAGPGSGAPMPFVAEKRSGQGLVIHVNFSFSSLMHGSWDRTLFVSPYYPVFWDNLLEYATGRKVLSAATVPPPLVAPPGPAMTFDLLADNFGDVFKPGGKVRLRPHLCDLPDYPYTLAVSLSGPNLQALPLATLQMTAADQEHSVTLPHLDRGEYTLHLEAKQGDRSLARTSQPFSIRLPLIDRDAFPFMVYWEGDPLSEYDQQRMAAHLKSIGFDSAGWLSGILYGRGYDGTQRLYNRCRFASRLQQADLLVHPVWYPVGYELHTGVGGEPGSIDRPSGLAKPDPAFPDEGIMPWFGFWQSLFADRMYGKMPLTAGFSAHDEIVARSIPLSPELIKAYGGNIPAPGAPGYYDFLKWYFRLTADFTGLARAICETQNPQWAYQNVVMPNSLVGHAGCLLDLPNSLAAHGWISPNSYHYGENALYHKSLWAMSVVWSATDFGRLARPGFTGGQLSNNYYDTFPEQVFGALTTGATFFNLYSHPTVNIESDGRPDERFAQIARRTTREASRIGRVLNHCDRQRARVAMLYPQATYVWDSHEKGWRPHFRGDKTNIAEGLEGYAEVDGGTFESDYLQRRYALKVAYHLLRETAGHVDVLHDSQVQRGDLSNYDVVVLAYAPQVEEATLRALRRFTEAGGMLLVTSDSGQLSEDNLPTKALFGSLPAVVGEPRQVSANYAGTRMGSPGPFSIANVLQPAQGAEVLFKFPDGQAACVRGRVGRGEAIVLGMPLAALLTEPNRPNRDLLADVVNRRASLISRPADGEFSAITFVPRRGDGRIFMIANHGKQPSQTRVSAWADESLNGWTLADIVSGETVPFEVADGQMTFTVSCPGQWGRALALLDKKPSQVAVSVAEPATAGGRLMISARVLGADRQPVHAPLAVDVEIKDPTDTVRPDLSGVRVAENGAWVWSLDWPVNAATGQWTVTVSEKISGASARGQWLAQ
jgi:hypothetical protein